MNDDLTAAEQAAYTLIYEGAHNADHAMLRLKPGTTCPRCATTARAVQPIIAAEVLDDAAEALAQAAALAGREPYPTSQRLRFGLTSGAQRLRDRAEAARQSGEGPTDG